MFGIPTEVISVFATLIGTIIVNRMGWTLPGQPSLPSTPPNVPPVTPVPTQPVPPIYVPPVAPPVRVNTGHPILDGMANAMPSKQEVQLMLLEVLQDVLVPKADPTQLLKDHLGHLLLNTANPNPPTAPVVVPAVPVQK